MKIGTAFWPISCKHFIVKKKYIRNICHLIGTYNSILILLIVVIFGLTLSTDIIFSLYNEYFCYFLFSIRITEIFFHLFLISFFILFSLVGCYILFLKFCYGYSSILNMFYTYDKSRVNQYFKLLQNNTRTKNNAGQLITILHDFVD